MVTNFDSLTVLDEALPNGAAAPAADAVEEAGFGCLETVRGGLPLRRLGVNGRITGLLYRLVVAQEFVNACAEPLEATYIFPLPARAGVTRFRLRVGERVIEGVLKERGAARAEYDQAIRAGHRAAIAEEERPEVFTVRAGNIPPGEAVGVELELAGPLAFADGEATFRFPLVVAPRYIPGIALDGPGVGQGTAWDTDAVPDASRISPPVLLPGQPNPVYLTFRMELDPAGLPLADLRASLHALRLNRAEGDIRVVELTPGAERLDRDFILRFRVGEASVCGGFSVYRDPDGETTALLTVVPPAPLPASLRPRDVVVLLDRSGSMEGWKMAAARRAAGRLLDALTERDRFGVLLFDDRIEEPAPSAGRLVAATDRNRFRAVEFLARVEARGGTEIAPALNRALQYFPDPPDAGRERILLFVTDGQVGNEDQLLHQIQQQARHCRIFAVGIDQAVNASLLERLASYGGGHCELVESEDRLDEVLRAVHRRLGAPLLTDIRLEPALEDVAPDTVDLFPGVPVRLGGRLRGPLPAQVAVTARTADGQPFRQVLTPMETPDSAVRTLWARARVLDLEHRFAARSPARTPVGGRYHRFFAALRRVVPLHRLRRGGSLRDGQSRRRGAAGDASGGTAGGMGDADGRLRATSRADGRGRHYNGQHGGAALSGAATGTVRNARFYPPAIADGTSVTNARLPFRFWFWRNRPTSETLDFAAADTTKISPTAGATKIVARLVRQSGDALERTRAGSKRTTRHSAGCGYGIGRLGCNRHRSGEGRARIDSPPRKRSGRIRRDAQTAPGLVEADSETAGIAVGG
jgi:Ca-activated chloride channel family protein